MIDLNFDVTEVILKVNKLEPKTVFQWKDIINDSDPQVNKGNGKNFKSCVENGLINAVAIGKDSSNIEWYVRKF